MGYREEAAKAHQTYGTADPHRRTPNQIHATKTAICQMYYNRMDITDMDQMSPDESYTEV